jgi:ribonuclease HI
MGSLNWNRPRRAFVPWYDRDLLPEMPAARAPVKVKRMAPPVRAKKYRPQPAAKPLAVAAGALAGTAALRTKEIGQARKALATATEAVVWCDGSAAPTNPGTMGMGTVIAAGSARVELYGGGTFGSNNAAELGAAILALEALPSQCRVTVCADSQYLVFGITKWIGGWRRKDFKRGGAPIPNAGLWRELDALNSSRSIRWQWIPGHSGNRGNEIADRLASLGRTL